MTFAAGSVAGMTSLVVCHPLDVIRTRLQTSTSAQYRGAVHCASLMVKQEGFLSLYKGMSSPLVAQAVYKAVMFGAYTGAQSMVRSVSGRPSSEPLSLAQLFACGSIAGGTNSFVVTPVELVRNRLINQFHSVKGSASASAPLYAGPIDCARQIIAAEGLTGMWRGLGPTLARDIPGVGAWYASYEVARRFLTPAPGPDGAVPPLSPLRLMTSGAAGGIGFWLVSLPLDTVKSLVQTDLTGKYKGGLDCARQTIQQEGLGRLYRGLSVALVRGIPGAGVVFMTQAMIMERLA